MWTLLLAACGAPGPAPADTEGIEHIPSTPEDSGTAPVDDGTADALFTFDRIHTVDLARPDDSWDGLYGDPYTFQPGDVNIDGDTVLGVGVRLRGKIGSFREITGKPKFKIEFDEYEGEQRLRGLKSIALNNEVVDCSYVKEPLGYRVFEQLGIPASRTSYARVTLNGEDYGLYVMVEVPDDQFLEDRFAAPDGNLYDGKYVYDGYGYTLLDFASGVDELFQLEEGTDVENADVVAISEAIAANVGTEGYHDTLGELVDWEKFHRFEAAEQWIGHVDGYAMNQNNYRVYFDPGTAKMEFVPWDFDYAFYEDYEWGMDWQAPRGTLAASCWYDARCYTEQQAAVAQVLADVDTDVLLAFIDEIDALTLEVAQEDPRRECQQAGIRRGRAQLRDWVEARGGTLTGQWGL